MGYATTQQQEWDAAQYRLWARAAELAEQHPGCWVPGHIDGQDDRPSDGAIVEAIGLDGSIHIRGRLVLGRDHGGADRCSHIRADKLNTLGIGPTSIIRPVSDVRCGDPIFADGGRRLCGTCCTHRTEGEAPRGCGAVLETYPTYD